MVKGGPPPLTLSLLCTLALPMLPTHLQLLTCFLLKHMGRLSFTIDRSWGSSFSFNQACGFLWSAQRPSRRNLGMVQVTTVLSVRLELISLQQGETTGQPCLLWTITSMIVTEQGNGDSPTPQLERASQRQKFTGYGCRRCQDLWTWFLIRNSCSGIVNRQDLKCIFKVTMGVSSRINLCWSPRRLPRVACTSR